MVTIDTLKSFRNLPLDPGERETFIQQHGLAGEAELLEMAVKQMNADDRNIRVAALRIIVQCRGPVAADGIVKGLSDPKKRMRKLALGHAGNFCQYASVRNALTALHDDERELPEYRWGAFYALTGNEQNLPDAALAALHAFAKIEQYRHPVLMKLASMKITERTKPLLEDYANNGTAEEAQIANRALQGDRIITLGSLPTLAERKHVQRTHDVAYGRVAFWVKEQI